MARARVTGSRMRLLLWLFFSIVNIFFSLFYLFGLMLSILFLYLISVTMSAKFITVMLIDAIRVIVNNLLKH